MLPYYWEEFLLQDDGVKQNYSSKVTTLCLKKLKELTLSASSLSDVVKDLNGKMREIFAGHWGRWRLVGTR